jgi:MFS family permease
MMASMGAAPAIADMLAVFKDASPQTMMLMTTAPAITMVLINLLFGKLATLFNRRTLFNTGMAGFLIGGVGPYFLDNLTAIFVMRGILGLGLGILVPLSMVLITDFFEGSEKNTVMGLQSVFVNIGGIIFPALGGFLCAINWRYTFLSYLLGVLVFLLVFYCLPEPAKVQSNTGTDNISAKTSLGGKVYFLQAVVFTYSVLLYIFFTNIAIEVVGENIGNAANAGMAMTIFTLGGMLTGFVFGKIMDAINIFTIPVGWILTGIGMVMIATTHNMNLILAGSLLAGIGFTVIAPACFVMLTNVAPPSGVASAIAILYALSGVGQFVSPVLAEFFILRQFDQVPGRFPILASSVAFIVLGVLILLFTQTQFLKSIGESSKQSINKPA